MRAKHCTLLLAFLLSCGIVRAQIGISMGFQVCKMENKLLKEWALAHYDTINFPSTITVPDFTMGPVIGVEWNKSNNWVMGFGISWNQRTVDAEEYDISGATLPMKVRFKYHTFEMPFHYFIGGGPVGLGLTLDVGRQKIVEYSTLFDGTKRNVLSELQIGHKFGLKFRTSKEGLGLTGMLYYQWTYFYATVYGYNQQEWDVKPIHIGFRLCLTFMGKN